MAHFAKLDENNVVTQVIVVNNEDVQNLSFPESEAVGIEFLTAWSGGYSNWKQTSYNNNFRKIYATIGGWYDPDKDYFVPVKPFRTWVWNEEKHDWEPPVPWPPEVFPEEDGRYIWDDDTVSFVFVHNDRDAQIEYSREGS